MKYILNKKISINGIYISYAHNESLMNMNKRKLLTTQGVSNGKQPLYSCEWHIKMKTIQPKTIEIKNNSWIIDLHFENYDVVEFQKTNFL